MAEMKTKPINEWLNELPNMNLSTSTNTVGVGDGQSGKLNAPLFYRVLWNTPDTLLSELTNLYNLVSPGGRYILIELYGYSSALLLFYSSVNYVRGTNFYTGKKFEAQNIDPNTLTITKLLSDYVVEDGSGESPSGKSSFVYNVENNAVTMSELINSLKAEGYIDGTPMGLALGGVRMGKYVGHIFTFGGNMFTFCLFDYTNLTLYVRSGGNINDTIYSAFMSATTTELGGGLPYEEVYWGNPDADMLDKVTEHVIANSAHKTIIQVVGYNSALLLANGYCHTSEGKMIWTLSVTNLYNGKMLYAEDVDPTTITLSDFLNSGKYEVKQESGGIIDVEADFPSEPSTTSIYRKWQVVKAVWVYANTSSGSLETTIATDGTMECEVVNTLPEVGNACYSGTSMYAYYQRTDGEVYGYVDSILSSAMGVPVGWYPAATLFSALDFTYNGMIDSIEDVTEGGYYALVTRKPHLYQFYNDSKGNIVKSAIITNDNYDFNETTGTLTQIIVL